MSTSFERPSPALALALLLVVGLGFTAAWCVLAASLHAQVAWMAPLAAVDALCMMQLGRMPPRWSRPAWAMATTLLTIVLANWGIAVIEIGRTMGLLPWESAPRLGMAYAWELARLANGPAEFAWYALALLVAAVGGSARLQGALVSGPRRAP